jgi:hypothetical protein
MVVLPVATAVTAPVLLLTVALAGLLDAHVPPIAASDNDKVIPPTHTADPPVMVPALGSGFTVTTLVAIAVAGP